MNERIRFLMSTANKTTTRKEDLSDRVSDSRFSRPRGSWRTTHRFRCTRVKKRTETGHPYSVTSLSVPNSSLLLCPW